MVGLSGPKGTKIGSALQRAVRGTFCPKDEKIHSLPTASICDRRRTGGERRCPLFYNVNKPH